VAPKTPKVDFSGLTGLHTAQAPNSDATAVKNVFRHSQLNFGRRAGAPARFGPHQ